MRVLYIYLLIDPIKTNHSYRKILHGSYGYGKVCNWSIAVGVAPCCYIESASPQSGILQYVLELHHDPASGKWRFRLGSPTQNVSESWWWRLGVDPKYVYVPSKQPHFNGCFNWMIPNLYLGNGRFTISIHLLFRIPGIYWLVGLEIFCFSQKVQVKTRKAFLSLKNTQRYGLGLVKYDNLFKICWHWVIGSLVHLTNSLPKHRGKYFFQYFSGLFPL